MVQFKKAVKLAEDIIKAGSTEIVITGGMESMTHALYRPKAQAGFRMGLDSVIDSTLFGSLEAANNNQAMGCCILYSRAVAI